MENGIQAIFNSGHIWAIIIGCFIFLMSLLIMIGKAINNGMFHIYDAVRVTNNNIKNIGTALQNHPATNDLKFEWVEIPPLHGKAK
jgi:uncharacterized membrane protein